MSIHPVCRELSLLSLSKRFEKHLMSWLCYKREQRYITTINVTGKPFTISKQFCEAIDLGRASTRRRNCLYCIWGILATLEYIAKSLRVVWHQFLFAHVFHFPSNLNDSFENLCVIRWRKDKKPKPMSPSDISYINPRHTPSLFPLKQLQIP